MAWDKFRLFLLIAKLLPPIIFRALIDRIAAIYHGWTYESQVDAQNVVVIGGSFAGLQLAKRLSQTLPTGYKVTMIEKNTHFNFSWVFPRFSVIPGYERLAFVPYEGVARNAPNGIWNHVHDSVTQITATKVHLASGQELDYAFLAIATGSSQPVPAKVQATDSKDGCAELRTIQQSIADADRIAVVGGGAVGVEIASDIKTFFPDKDVTLFHSRSQLLPTFGQRLHEYVSSALDKLGVHVVCSERPEILSGKEPQQLRTSKGVLDFDLIIPCTGQQPNSALLHDLSPTTISKQTHRILVKPTLQILDTENPTALPQIFALGDVAETGAPRMSRAGMAQAETALQNILAMIRGREPSATYTPNIVLEGTLKLTLGKKHNVVYVHDGHGLDVMVPGKAGKEDLDIARVWEYFGVGKLMGERDGGENKA